MAIQDAERRPRNALERILWLHGRKFYIAVFAGVSAFVVSILGMWIVARTSPETGRIVEQIVAGYLWTSAGMVGVYSGTNAVVERAHANKGTAAHTQSSRPSGTVPPPEGE